MAAWDDLSPSSLVKGDYLKQALDSAAAATAAAAANTTALAAADPGAVATTTLPMANQPTATDYVGIGSDRYEFLANGGTVADDANIAVEIGATAALTLINLRDAVNAADANNLHANALKADRVTPALANGTKNVVADIISTTLRVRNADAPGGTVTAGSPDLALTEAVTHASVVWNVGDVNLNTLGGKAASAQPPACSAITITAAMVTNKATPVRLSFPFTVTRFTAQVRTAVGLQRTIADAAGVQVAPADTFTIANGDVVLTLNGGASPDIQATDIVTVTAWP